MTNIEDRERLSKTRIVKKWSKLIERAKMAVKEIINDFEGTIEPANDIIYTATYVITEKLNGKSKKLYGQRNAYTAMLEIK